MNLSGRLIKVSFSDSGKRKDIIGDEPGFELTEKKCKLIYASLNKGSNLASEADIIEIFSKFGDVKCIQAKSCTGFRPSVYIEYSKCEEAEKAVKSMNSPSEEESRKKLGDKQCDIDYYFKKKKYINEITTINNIQMNPQLNHPENQTNMVPGKIPYPQIIPGMFPLGMNPLSILFLFI